MKKVFTALTVALFILCTGAAFAEVPIIEEQSIPVTSLRGEFVEGEALVVLEGPAGVSVADTGAFEAALSSSANSVAASVGAKAMQTYAAIAASSGKNIVHMQADGKSTAELLAALEGAPGVLGASPNYISKVSAIPNDLRYGELWGMTTSSAPAAWDVTTGSRSLYVAVLDTGANYLHEDLAANMGLDLASRRGYNAIDKNFDPWDGHGHGTHVSGTIGAAGNNGIGVAGVNWLVSLLPVKVLDDGGSGSDDEIIDGLNYVLAQKQGGLNIRVANLSLGGWRPPIADPNTSAYGIAYRQLSDAGVLVVVAAGNEYQNIDAPGGPGSNPNNPGMDYRGLRPYPACFQFANMITVASITNTTVRSDFSNYSPNFVHLAAPGSSILSTTNDGAYGTMSGTSMASPHVAGTAALIAAARPVENAGQIKTRILNNVTPNANLNGLVKQNGHLNIDAAIRAVAPPAPVRVTGVTVVPTSRTLGIGERLTLTATVLPANATDNSVTWTISDTSILSGTASGLTATVTALRLGTARVTVRTNDGGFTAVCTITVSEAPIGGDGGGCSVGAGAALPSALLLLLPLAMLLKRGSK